MAPAGTITLSIPGLLRPLTGDAEQLDIDVEAAAPLREILDTVAASFPVFNRRIRNETGALRRYVNVYIAGDDVRGLGGLDAPVGPGQEVLIIASVAGG
ncbi:MAG: MoaD/ThiS family protein [Actinomycetales bacterium]|jgi:molybdopterin converting factor small subunit